jgi:dihydroorotase
VVVDIHDSTKAGKNNILYKCGWSPLEDFTFPAAITNTMVNGNMVYEKGSFNESYKGKRLSFNRL